MRRLLMVTALAALCGCALRPTYKSYVTPDAKGKELKLLLVEKATGQPMPNVKIEMSEWKNRFTTTTAADGTFSLPVEKRYLDENPVLVVSVPVGVQGYELRAVAPPGPVPAPVAPEAAGTNEPVKM